MYDLMRRIHLYAAALVLSFVVMYFVSGYPMIHGDLLANPKPVESTRVLPLDYAGEKNPQAYSIYLQEKFGLRGKRQEPRHRRDGSWRFRYFRPGTRYEAVVYAGGDSVRITKTRDHLRRTLTGFHALHGYGGGWLYDLWALLYDLASLALIVFAATGIYLWYKLTRKRLLGWIILGSSFAYAGATILYLIYAP